MPTYYVPELSEFHYGFQYEEMEVVYFKYKEEHGESRYKNLPLIEVESKSDPDRYKIVQWSLYSFDFTCSNPSELILRGRIRIKHLDPDDIKECGWEFIPDDSVGDGGQRWFELFRKEEFKLLSFTENKVIVKKNEAIIFEGAILNKSELLFQMSRLGIKQKQ